MSVLDNIEKVVSDGLCTGCGTCAGICPVQCIVMQVSNGLLLPTINYGKCVKCSKCVECCPGFLVDLQKLNAEIFGKQPEDPDMGNFLECYLGHSNDYEVKSVSSSGGVVSQILVYALEKKIIDGAIVVRMKKDDPLRSEAFITRTREEVLSASRSKYCPAASAAALSSLLAEKGKFAVVGLPCHLHGIRKAEAVFPALKDRILFHIGLFCGHTVSFEGTRFVLKKLQVPEEDVSSVRYRGNGWPDSMSITLKSGHDLGLRFNRCWSAYWNVFSPFFFTPLRCMMCPDEFNELADVSVGDAWLPELRRSRSAESVVIARTELAKEMLDALKRLGLLSLRAISINKVKQSQAFGLNYKKRHLYGRLSVFRWFGRKTPRIYPEPSRSSYMAHAGALLSLLSVKACSSRRARSLLVHVPLPLFRLYFGLFRSLSLLSGEGRY